MSEIALFSNIFLFIFWVGDVDEVGYFMGEVKIFSIGLLGGNICFLKNDFNG